MDLDQHKDCARIAASLIREHQCPTPFLFFDEAKLESALELFQTNLPDVRTFYAVKANPSPCLIAFFAAKGLSFDVASAGEIDAVRGLGVSGERLFLSTPVKTIETIESLFANRISSFVVDSKSELERIDAYRKAHRHTHEPKVFIRIRIESKHVEVDLNTKFGCSIAEALDIIERASEFGYEVAGICFHVGTQSTDADNYFLGIRSAMLVADEALRRFGQRISVINIGGGFCDHVAAARAKIELPAFYEAVGAAVRQAVRAGYEIYAEPGRCLVSAAGSLVTSVLSTSVRNGRQWAYLDDGIYGCYSIKLYEKHPFEFVPVNYVGQKFKGENGTAPAAWTIAGPTCDSLDVIAEDVTFQHAVRTGDVLVTPNLGAYTISTASAFNGFSQPECHLVRASSKANGKLTTSLLKLRKAPAGSEKTANA